MASSLMFKCMAKMPDLAVSKHLGSRLYHSRSGKPLRILFCGSDEFSIASLRALHQEQKQYPLKIRPIEVLCRPGKPSGRSMKFIKNPPIKAVAQELGLKIYERDTFTGWDLPDPDGYPINLIIAVSFGLFVPPRILRSVEFGGWNVHPSILPQFRGPAPLQYTILTGDKRTGITIQTLDENSFDAGTVITQTAPPGLPIPSPETITYNKLLEWISPIGGRMLVNALRQNFHKSPKLKQAGKIGPNDRKIFWHRNNGQTIERKYRALERIWGDVSLDAETTKRLIFQGISVVNEVPRPINIWQRVTRIKSRIPNYTLEHHLKEISRKLEASATAEPKGESSQLYFFISPRDDGLASRKMRPVSYIEDGDAVIIETAGEEAIRVETITIEGKGPQSARQALASIRDNSTVQLHRDEGGHFVAQACTADDTALLKSRAQKFQENLAKQENATSHEMEIMATFKNILASFIITEEPSKPADAEAETKTGTAFYSPGQPEGAKNETAVRDGVKKTKRPLEMQ